MIDQRQAHQALVDAVKRVELRNPPFPIRLRVEDPHRFAPPTMVVEATIANRDDGRRSIVVHRFEVTDHRLGDWIIEPEYLDRWIYDSLRKVFEHELAEAFHVNGVRVNDPHVGGAS